MKKKSILLISLSLFSILILSCTPKNYEANIIKVTAKGSVSRSPDTAELVFGVDTRAATVTEAFSKNQEAMKSLKNTLLELGIPENSMKTTNYSVTFNDGSSSYTNNAKLEGIYRVYNSILLVTKDVDNVGSIIDAAINAGANELHSLKFRVSEIKTAEEEAQIKAIENAKAKAEIMANAAGRKLGKALTITSERDSSLDYLYPMGLAYMSSAETVSPGETEISTTVQVIFKLR